MEVGQEPPEPAVVDVGHVGALGRVTDGVAGLLLGSHEHDGAAAAGDVLSESPRVLQQRFGLQEIDDVDAVPLAEDEAAHLRVPPAGLVAEMNSGLQELLDSKFRHCPAPLDRLIWRRLAESWTSACTEAGHAPRKQGRKFLG